jgi:hypothetical protein
MTRAGLAFLPLFACVGAAPPTDDALRAWRPTLEIAATDPIFGLEQTITVSIDGNTRPDVQLAVFASAAPGAGPCDPRTGQCLQLAPPLQRVAQRRAASPRSDTFRWTPPAALSAGASVYVQVALLYNGRAIAVSNVDVSTVLPYRPGCRWDGSPNYDPSANVDDGSCACPQYLTVDSMAALSPYLGCARLGSLTVQDAQDPLVELPNLRKVERLTLFHSPAVTRLSLPTLTEAYFLDVQQNDALTRLDAPALVSAHGIDLHLNPRFTTLNVGTPAALTWITAVDMPALTELVLPGLNELDYLEFQRCPVLTRVDLRGLHRLNDLLLMDTPSLTSLDVGQPTDMNALYLIGAVPGVISLPSVSTLGDLAFFETAQPQRVELPGIARLDGLDLSQTHHPVQIDAPRLRHVQRAEVYETDNLGTLDLSQVDSAGELVFRDNAGLQRIDLQSLTTLGYLSMVDNQALDTLDLSALSDSDWSVVAEGNPALCVTAIPALGSPPPGCSVEGSGNACDP